MKTSPVALITRAVIVRNGTELGASIVSFMLVTPVVLLVLLGLIQFGLIAFERAVVRDVVNWTGSIAQIDHRLRIVAEDPQQQGVSIREAAIEEIQSRARQRFEMLIGGKSFEDYNFVVTVPPVDELDDTAILVSGEVVLKSLPLFPVFTSVPLRASAAFLAEPAFSSTMPAVITCHGLAVSSIPPEQLSGPIPTCPCEGDPDPRKMIGKHGTCVCRPLFSDDGQGNCQCSFGSVPVQHDFAGMVYEGCECPSCGDSQFIRSPEFSHIFEYCDKDPNICSGNPCDCQCIPGAGGDPSIPQGAEGACACQGNKIFVEDSADGPRCECPAGLCPGGLRANVVETPDGCSCECRNYGHPLPSSGVAGRGSNRTLFEPKLQQDGTYTCECDHESNRREHWNPDDPRPEDEMCPASHPYAASYGPGAVPAPICDACLSCWGGAGGVNTTEFNAQHNRCECLARDPSNRHLIPGPHLDALRAHCGPNSYANASHPRGCLCTACPEGQVSLQSIRTSGTDAFRRDECGCQQHIDQNCPPDRRYMPTCECLCLEDGEPKECGRHEETDENCDCQCEEGVKYPLRNAQGEYVDPDGQQTGTPTYKCQPPGDFCGAPGACYWEGGRWIAPE